MSVQENKAFIKRFNEEVWKGNQRAYEKAKQGAAQHEEGESEEDIWNMISSTQGMMAEIHDRAASQDSEHLQRYIARRRTGTACAICQTVCPWSKPENLFHAAVAELAIRVKCARRMLVWGDDLVYRRKHRRVPAPGWLEE